MTDSKRTWRSKQENPIDPPPGGIQNYRSFQKVINSNNGQIDEDLLQAHIDMILDKGWEEIPVSFELLIKGDQIRYTTYNKDTEKGPKKYLFRTGGWVTAIDEENDPPDWMAYMSHTKSTWCVQLEDLQRLFVYRKPKVVREPKPKEPQPVMFKQPGEETNFNVYLPDDEGVLQRVFSARDNYAKNRFENSKKFQRAKEIGWFFKDEQS